MANHLRQNDPRTRAGHCLSRLFLVSCLPYLQVPIRFNKETRKAGRKNGALVLCHSLILGCMRVNSFRFSRCFSREPTRILSCDEALASAKDRRRAGYWPAGKKAGPVARRSNRSNKGESRPSVQPALTLHSNTTIECISSRGTTTSTPSAIFLIASARCSGS